MAAQDGSVASLCACSVDGFDKGMRRGRRTTPGGKENAAATEGASAAG
jgi:hypothetical protein